MKSPKNWKLVLLLFLAIVTIQSCEKDVDGAIDPTSVTDQETTEPDFNTNTDNGNQSDNWNSDTPTDSDEGSITLYRVDGDNLIKEKDFNVSGKQLEFQKDTEKHQEIWELTKKIIPANYRSKMSRFMIFAGEANGSSGYVYNTTPDLTIWEMGIAVDFAYEGGFNAGGELAYTIIHEFGHILTLEKTQLDSSIKESDCKEYFAGEGCAGKEAYINKTYQKGWADIWNEFLTVQGKESQSASEEFYDKYQDRFVTNYASSNPAEDIAEVFATFVTRNGGVNGKSIAEQKIQIMYDHTALIGLRDYIRGNGASAKRRSFLPLAGSWKKAATFGNPKRTGCLKHMR